MQCDDLGPQMLEYLAGTLPDDELAEIRAHLTQCAACRDEMDATAELWDELGRRAGAAPGVGAHARPVRRGAAGIHRRPERVAAW